MSSATARRVGFDEIADMIRDLSLDVSPVTSKLRGALIAASMNVNTSFVVSTGKKKRKVDGASSSAPTPSCTAHAKRRCSATVTPSSPSTVVAGSISTGSSLTAAAGSSLTAAAGSILVTRNASLAVFHAESSHPSTSGSVAERSNAMLIDRDFVPHHSTSRTSVIQPIYRRLLPADIVRLMAGDKIIVVVPIHGQAPRKGEDADARRFHYRKLFENVIRLTFRGQDSADFLDRIIRDRHTLIRGGRPYLEFPCRIKHYAERELFERLGTPPSAVKHSWSQGAGLNLSVCGYTHLSTILLQFQHVGYLEIYKRVYSDDPFVNEGIVFTKNARAIESLLTPFLHQLALFEGCRIGTMEVLWKYYRATANSHQRREVR
jgi:hypothetical protein